MGRQEYYREEESCCTCRKIFSGLVTLALVATGVGLAVYYLVPGGKQVINDNITLPPGLEDLPQHLWDLLDDIKLFQGDSIFNTPGMQQNPDDAVKWRTDGSGGLTLELVNALSSEWHTYFDESVTDWDNGSPDSLTLTTSVAAAPLPDCPDDQADGIMLVCNDDYGETDWKGINKVLMQNGWIIASTARMNDRFFGDNDQNKRLYTMCHEIGHGFGLAHTDETFWNRDLGNCLDYTTRFEGSMRPDVGNYQFLAALYGIVGGGSYEYPNNVASDSNSGSTTSTTNGQNGGSSDGGATINDEVPGGDNFNRKHRQLLLRSSSSTTSAAAGPVRQQRSERRALFYDVPVERRRLQMLADLKDVDRIVNTRGLLHSDSRWNILHQTEHGSAHEMDLGEGYTVQVHMLRA